MQMGQTDTAWYDLLGRFKAKAAEFSDVYARVVQSEAIVKNNPELMKERKNLLMMADKVKVSVEGLTGAVDTAYNFLKNTLGMGSYNNELQGGGMGALPLIPVAAAGIAITGMTKIISDSLIYLDKVSRFEQLSKEHGPDKALKIAQGLSPNSTFAGDLVKSLAPFLLIAGGVWFFKDRIFK